jgi:hypothetical protein
LYRQKYFAMKKNLNALIGNGIIPAMVMLFLAMQSVSGEEAYLKSVGPPPLRFQYVDNSNSLFLQELALPTPRPVEQPPMPKPQAEAAPETHIATSGPVGPLGPFFPGPGNNALSPGGSASDMLSITPQMISDYFKPYRAEGADDPGANQRGQTLFVPAELGFVPPMAGSRATYNSK